VVGHEASDDDAIRNPAGKLWAVLEEPALHVADGITAFSEDVTGNTGNHGIRRVEGNDAFKIPAE